MKLVKKLYLITLLISSLVSLLFLPMYASQTITITQTNPTSSASASHSNAQPKDAAFTGIGRTFSEKSNVEQWKEAQEAKNKELSWWQTGSQALNLVKNLEAMTQTEDIKNLIKSIVESSYKDKDGYITKTSDNVSINELNATYIQRANERQYYKQDIKEKLLPALKKLPKNSKVIQQLKTMCDLIIKDRQPFSTLPPIDLQKKPVRDLKKLQEIVFSIYNDFQTNSYMVEFAAKRVSSIQKALTQINELLTLKKGIREKHKEILSLFLSKKIDASQENIAKIRELERLSQFTSIIEDKEVLAQFNKIYDELKEPFLSEDEKEKRELSALKKQRKQIRRQIAKIDMQDEKQLLSLLDNPPQASDEKTVEQTAPTAQEQLDNLSQSKPQIPEPKKHLLQSTPEVITPQDDPTSTQGQDRAATVPASKKPQPMETLTVSQREDISKIEPKKLDISPAHTALLNKMLLKKQDNRVKEDARRIQQKSEMRFELQAALKELESKLNDESYIKKIGGAKKLLEKIIENLRKYWSSLDSIEYKTLNRIIEQHKKLLNILEKNYEIKKLCNKKISELTQTKDDRTRNKNKIEVVQNTVMASAQIVHKIHDIVMPQSKTKQPEHTPIQIGIDIDGKLKRTEDILDAMKIEEGFIGALLKIPGIIRDASETTKYTAQAAKYIASIAKTIEETKKDLQDIIDNPIDRIWQAIKKRLGIE